jgi:hypothetical protein
LPKDPNTHRMTGKNTESILLIIFYCMSTKTRYITIIALRTTDAANQIDVIRLDITVEPSNDNNVTKYIIHEQLMGFEKKCSAAFCIYLFNFFFYQNHSTLIRMGFICFRFFPSTDDDRFNLHASDCSTRPFPAPRRPPSFFTSSPADLSSTAPQHLLLLLLYVERFFFFVWALVCASAFVHSTRRARTHPPRV